MSFENVYRSREGTREINKITNFVTSLVIKNNYEANAAETSESVGNYYEYFGAYTKTDTFNDYSSDERNDYQYYVAIYLNSLNLGYSESEIAALPKMSMTQLTNSTSELVKNYLTALRVTRIYRYDEKNTYYRQFLGLPNTEDDYVNIVNFDADGANDDGYIEADTNSDPIKNIEYFTYDSSTKTYTSVGILTNWIDNVDYYYKLYIYAHEMSYETYPNTYTYYIIQDNIQTIITENPYKIYLRFLSSSFTAYTLRNLPNYSIIKYTTGILDSTELEYFMKAYNKSKAQIVADYIDGFDSKQPMYNLAMIMNLLYYTVIYYSNSYIERFSLCDYTEENLNDILNSYGYSKLVDIEDIDIKRRVVANLNDLISNKGNNYVLELLLDRVIKSDDAELKRYYIEKKYTTDSDFAVKINTSKSLENSVSLVFRETPALSDNKTTTEDVYHDYDEFVSDDDKWAGINDTDTSDIVKYKRSVLKKKILGLNFNSILTKYITLTKTVDVLESQRNLRDSLYLMLKYFDINSSDMFFSNKILFSTVECTPSSLFAAMCWLQQMKYYDNPDTIVKDTCLINNTAVFRQFGKSTVCQETFENTFIKNGKVCTSYDITTDLTDWNVVDFLKKDDEISTIQIGNVLKYKNNVTADGYKHVENYKEDISDYVMAYRYYKSGVQLGEVTTDTTFADLITDYQNEYPNLIKHITERLRDSYDLREYQAWLFLLNQNRMDNSIYFIFKGCTTYSEYIKSCDSNELISWLNTALASSAYGSNKLERICTVLQLLCEAFRSWVDSSFSTLVYKYSLDDTSDNYVSDMILLFNEFLSAYSELYSVDYRYSLGDNTYQGLYLQIFYNPLNILFKDKYTDKIMLYYKQASQFYDKYYENLLLEYEGKSYSDDHFYDCIIGDLDYNSETNKYIPDDFTYESDISFTNNVADLVSFDYYQRKSNEYISINESIGLSDTLKITVQEN